MAASKLEDYKKALAAAEKFKADAIAELKVTLEGAEAEVRRIKSEIAELSGEKPAKGKATRTRKKPVEKDSDEYNELVKAAKAVLAKEGKEGLNGTATMLKAGIVGDKEVKRAKVVLEDTRHFKKTGKGVSTRYFLK